MLLLCFGQVDDDELLCLLAGDRGGKGGGKFALKIVQLGLQREQGLVNLLLVVPVATKLKSVSHRKMRTGYLPVDTWGGEGGDPGEGDEGQSVDDGPDVCQQIHGGGELQQEHLYREKIRVF